MGDAESLGREAALAAGQAPAGARRVPGGGRLSSGIQAVLPSVQCT